MQGQKKPITILGGIDIFRKQFRGLAQGLRNAVTNKVLRFVPEPVAEGLVCELNDVVQKLEELRCAVDRNTAMTVPALYAMGDELVSIGYAARVQTNAGQRQADAEIPNYGGDQPRPNNEPADPPDAGAELPY